jgi:hypothetical protein
MVVSIRLAVGGAHRSQSHHFEVIGPGRRAKF